MEPEYIVSLIIPAIATYAFYRMRKWEKTWETKMIAQDDRLKEHEDRHLSADIKLAVLAAELKYIKDTTDSTSDDVKKLLQNVGTNRSTG